MWLKSFPMTQGFHAVPSEAVVLLWTVASVVQVQCHWIPNTCLPGSFHQPHPCLTMHACVGTFASLCLPSPQLLKVSSLLTFSLACTIVSGSAVSEASQPADRSEIGETDPSVSSDYKMPYSLKARPETTTAMPGPWNLPELYIQTLRMSLLWSQMTFPLSKAISPSPDLSNPAPTYPSVLIPSQIQILSRHPS